MRRASFMHTKSQMRMGAGDARANVDGIAYVGKSITRRLHWRWCTPGMYLLAVAKSQGLRRGELVEVFGVVQVTLRLADYSGGDMAEWPADLRVREVPA